MALSAAARLSMFLTVDTANALSKPPGHQQLREGGQTRRRGALAQKHAPTCVLCLI